MGVVGGAERGEVLSISKRFRTSRIDKAMRITNSHTSHTHGKWVICGVATGTSRVEVYVHKDVITKLTIGEKIPLTIYKVGNDYYAVSGLGMKHQIQRVIKESKKNSEKDKGGNPHRKGL